MDRREVLGVLGRRHGARSHAPAAPTGLRVKRADATTVILSWKPGHGGAKAARYAVLRDRKRLGTTRATTFTDHSVQPNQRYRYEVKALGRSGRASRSSRALSVQIPPAAAPTGGGSSGSGSGSGSARPGVDPIRSSPPTTAAGSGNPTPPATSGASGPGPVVIGTTLPVTMVDRLFWRAGFGPSDADRQQWSGRDVGELVDFFLSTPNSLTSTSKPPLTQGNGPIDPLASDDELVADWIDRMQRSTNPFVERLTFFLHRHWAVSRNDGTPAQFMLSYANRLRSYADLGANPSASFRDLALDMTTKDAAMSLFLTGFQNTKNHPNENYAREFMELFCLGVVDANGNPNYTQADVSGLARAFTGWRLNQDPNSANFGAVTFSQNSFDTGTKTILGQTGAFTAAQAVDIVLAHPNHAPYLARKLWGEFIATPPPQDVLDDLVSTYTSSGRQLKPLLRRILTNALLFESLDEPNLVKPPIVQAVGVLKAVGAPLKWFWIPEAMRNMQQQPYFPPNVAGWEGGLSWLNTNTAQSRFDLALRALYLRYSTSGSSYPGNTTIPDVPGESAVAAFDRAYMEVGSPWLSDGARNQLSTYANSAPAGTVTQRAQRQFALRALMLGGPDAQVM